MSKMAKTLKAELAEAVKKENKVYEVWFSKLGVVFPNVQPNPDALEETHVHVKDVTAQSLEQVFMKMQGGIWSPNGEARELIKSKGLTHTSMSIGDAVKIDGKIMVVMGVGWEVLKSNKKEEPTYEDTERMR